jgi:dTDP-4-amino-4,6-dideoxygalactose transaminase
MYRGRMVGSFGDVAAFSFCQDKIISTGGEGGLVVCNDDELWSCMWSFKDHGKSYEAVYQQEHPAGFRWLHESFGTNWRITEMQAAIGLVQLGKLEQWGERRRAHREAFHAELAGFAALRIPHEPEYIRHAAYRAYVFIRPECLRPEWSRDRIMQAMAGKGLPCMSGSCSEVYREKAFATTSFRPATDLPQAHALGETSLAFPVHPTLSRSDMVLLGSALREIVLAATHA